MINKLDGVAFTNHYVVAGAAMAVTSSGLAGIALGNGRIFTGLFLICMAAFFLTMIVMKVHRFFHYTGRTNVELIPSYLLSIFTSSVMFFLCYELCKYTPNRGTGGNILAWILALAAMIPSVWFMVKYRMFGTTFQQGMKAYKRSRRRRRY